MDPISIAVSALSVAGAAAKISIWLYDVAETTSRIDQTVVALGREVKTLDDNLKSLSRTLQGCQSQALTLMHMNDDIWRSIENNLHDCGEALEELQTLVDEIKKPIASRNIFRKPNLAVRLGARKKEISEFQDKISKSNSAMQTAVGVVSLSLALRQNVSSDMLMSELQRLRGLVENTQRAARDSSSVSYPAAARMSRSLQSLARAAQKFHSNASTTASTRYEGGYRQSRPQGGHSQWLGSDAGSLSDFERDRIRDWRSGLRPIDEVTDTASTVGTTPTATTTTDRETVITTPEPEEEDDDDLELDLEIFQNAEELGRLSFAKRDYDNAEKFLNKAMSGATGTSSDPAHFDNLKLQLSICYCFQSKWQAAEAVLSTLGKKKRKTDLPVFHLLHAVALAHLADEKYDSAYNACKRSLQGKKKAFGGKTNQDYIDSLCLLAAICEVRGDPIDAAAIRHMIPGNKMQSGFPMPQEFIRSHKSIIDDAFGKGFNSSDEAGPSSGGQVIEEEDDTWSLHASEGDATERHEQDTGKEIITPDNGERVSNQVGGWDTGKEILSVPVGSHMTVNHVTNKRIFSDVETFDEETGKLLAWAEWDSCEWVPLQRYFEAHHYMIDDLIIDEQARKNHNLPSLPRMRDEDKHSDLLVVDIERRHNIVFGTDSMKEVYVPEQQSYPRQPPEQQPYPQPEQSYLQQLYPQEPYPQQPYPQQPYPQQPYPQQPYPYPERPYAPHPGLGISSYQTQPPRIDTTLADDFSSNLYIAEPRGDGVTSAPPLHTHNSMDSTLLSPTSPAAYRHNQGSRSVDFATLTTEQSNNPFRRAASQRNLHNPVTETLKHTASFESPTRPAGPPAPWSGRRYGTARNTAPRLLQTPLVFLRDVPEGKTDGLILGVHLGLETAEVAVSFDTGTIETCPGTLYLNHASKPPTSIPWFDCLNHTHGSPPPLSPSSPTPSSDTLSLTTHPYHLLQILQTHALQSQSPLSTSKTLPLPSPSTYSTATTTLSSSLARLAAGLAKWIDTTRGAFYLAFTPLDEVVFAVPDALLSLPGARQKLLDILSANPLFAHAKVTPASVSVVWFYLRTRPREVLLSYSSTPGPGRNNSVHVLVVQAGQLLTELARYEIVAENGAVVLRPAGEGRGEVATACGAIAVEVEFARVAHEKVRGIVTRYKMRMGRDKLMALVRTCAEAFRREVLLEWGQGRFADERGRDGKWFVDGLDVPPGFPGLEDGRVAFSYAEIGACFEGTMARVAQLVGEEMRRGAEEDGPVSNLFLTGCFAKSPLLEKTVEDAVEGGVKHRGSAPRLWVHGDCTSHGAVMQAKQLDFVTLQTS